MSASSRIRERGTARAECESSPGTVTPRLSQQRLHLPKVVEIVTGHRFDDYPQGHVAAFGMIQRLVKILSAEPRDQRQIPLANRGESGQRHAGIVMRIGNGEPILIERLNDVVVFSQSLPQPERKHNLAIREVTEYVANAPFAWSRRNREFFRTPRPEKIFKLDRSGPSYLKRVLTGPISCVRIRSHKS